MNVRIHILICGLALTTACAIPQAPAELYETVEQSSYVLGPEDMLEISVWRNESVSRTVPVRPDGMISLPLVNDIEAAGMTPMELRDVLAKQLAKFIPEPEVSVIVREVRSAAVSVFGEVARPGRYLLRGPTMLVEILADAGGLTEFASRNEVVVLRSKAKGVERMVVSQDEMLGKSTKQKVYLRPGDIVVVP